MTMAAMGHENLNREQHVEGASDRGFGLVFAGVFAVLALWPLIHGAQMRWWAAGVGAVFLLLAVFKSSLLAPLNRAWMRFGILLGKVVSPVALGVLFFLVITPIGLLVRMTGKDPLRLKLEPSDSSYWIRREPVGPDPESLTNQF
jgi:hypothetical protein